jgi:hypothetical protein
MPTFYDGPQSALFQPVSFTGNADFTELIDFPISSELAVAATHAPVGIGVAWGIPFDIAGVVALHDQAVTIPCQPTTARWFVSLHTSDIRPPERNADGFVAPMRDEGQLTEHAADYVMLYEDGSEEREGINLAHFSAGGEKTVSRRSPSANRSRFALPRNNCARAGAYFASGVSGQDYWPDDDRRPG